MSRYKIHARRGSSEWPACRAAFSRGPKIVTGIADWVTCLHCLALRPGRDVKDAPDPSLETPPKSAK